MELIKLDFCRLCAKEKYSDEIFGQLDNESLDIERKLIACCRWSSFDEIDSEKLPKDVCINCVENLQRCWEFSEQIRCAQHELISKLLNKVQIEMETDDNQSGFSHESIKSNDLDFDESPASPASDTESTASSHDNHLDTIEYDETDHQDNVNDLEESFIIERHEIEAPENIVAEEQDDKSKPSIPFNGRNFSEAISKEDRNNDGTVKPEAIQRLGLENWTIVQYRCYLCQTRLSDRYEWRNHMKIEHPGHRIKHLCNICNVKEYTVRKPLLRHIMNQHRHYFKHCCTKCNTYYWDLERLRSHLSRCKPEQSKLSLCDICGKECRTESVLRTHRRSHSLELRRIYECYLCRKSGLSRNNVKHHMLMTHIIGKPQFTCDQCGKAFGRKEQCTRHMKTHVNEFPFECTQCSKKFRFKVGLKTHIRTHTGDRPYQCILCPYRCADSGNLAKHMRQKHGTTKTAILQKQAIK